MTARQIGIKQLTEDVGIDYTASWYTTAPVTIEHNEIVSKKVMTDKDGSRVVRKPLIPLFLLCKSTLLFRDTIDEAGTPDCGRLIE